MSADDSAVPVTPRSRKPKDVANHAKALFDAVEKDIFKGDGLRRLVIKGAEILVNKAGGLEKAGIAPERWEKVVGRPYGASGPAPEPAALAP
jgi:hypothetical protein